MSHIFISYSRKDLAFAQKIVDALAANDLDTWIDWKSIPKGEDWWEHIQSGIEEADAFIFLISPDSIKSRVCSDEIDHAVNNRKRILPVVLEDVTPKDVHPEISKRNWIFCREGQDDFEKAITETHDAFRTDYEWLKYHTRLQVKALEWERRKDKKDTSRLLRGKELQEAEDRLAITGNQTDPQPTELQRHFLLAGQRNEKRQRRQSIIILCFGLIVVTTLAFFAWRQRNSALASEATAVAESDSRATAQAEAEQQARIALARQLAVQSQSVSDPSPILSLLLAVESVKATTQFGDPVVPEAYQLIVNRLGSVGGKPLVGHTAGITSLAFTPGCSNELENCWLVTGSKDGTIRLWDFESNKSVVSSIIVGTINGEVSQLDISPDGQWLASGGSDGIVRLWDLQATYSDVKSIELEGHENAVNLVAFTPDGNHLISSDLKDTKIWNLEPKVSTEPRILVHDPVIALAFSHDGHWLAAGGIGFVVYLWDLWSEDPTVIRQEFSVGETIYALDFSEDGKWLAAGSEDNLSRVWALSASESEVNPIILESHTLPVKTLGFAKDDVLLTGSSDGDIRVWPMGLGYATNSSVVRGSPGLSQIKIGPNGDVVAITANNTLRLWSEMWYSYPQTSSSHEGRINTVAFSSDSEWVATGSEDGVARIYSIRDGLVANPHKISKAELSKLPPTTSFLNNSTRDMSYADLQSAHPMLDLSSLQNSDDWYSVAASPSGRWLLICDWVSKCWLWDMQVAYPSAASKILKGHTSGIVSQAFSADEQWLLTSGLNDRTIVVSDLTGPNLVAQSIVLSPGQPLVIQYFDPDEGWLIAQGVEHEQETWVWQLKWEDLIILACQITGRNMTRTEWAQYLPDKPYRITCPQWSAGQ